MFSKRRRISNPKKEILRSVYYDNLRIAGDFKEVALPSRWNHLYRHMKLLSMIVITAALCAFPELSMDSELPQMVIESAAEEPQGVPAPSTVEAALLVEQTQPDLLEAVMGFPLFDVYMNGNQNSQDYSLLLSRSDHVRLSSLFGLDVKNIVIDPGHGGRDPGAIGAKGTKEKDITLDVSIRLKKRLLRRQSYNVLLTRETDRTLSLAQRVEFAKSNKGDLFISIHVNSLPNQTLNVIETYYFGPPLNSEILRLAQRENKESHYGIGELDSIIQDIGKTLKRQESAMLAASIQESLFRNVRHHDDQVLDVGIKMAPFVVLSRIEVPSVLVEISCLTKEEEEVKLASAEYREKIASFIEEGIIRYLEKQHSIKK